MVVEGAVVEGAVVVVRGHEEDEAVIQKLYDTGKAYVDFGNYDDVINVSEIVKVVGWEVVR